MNRKTKMLSVALTATVALGGLTMLLVGPNSMPGVVTGSALAPVPGEAPLELRIWRPELLNRTDKLPLIVMSHGTGGSAEGHEDTAVALARAGFIVVAPTHTGDNYRDLGAVGRGSHFIDRPGHIARTIDYMLSNSPHRANIDKARIGMFGFSAGGTTALIIAGAEPELQRGADYCRIHPQAWSCRYVQRQGLSLEDLGKRRNHSWVHDPRVSAIVIAAPAIGYSFDRANLAKVIIPVQLWSAERDEIVDDSPATIRAAMVSQPEFHQIANAGHFSFLAPCSLTVRAIIKVMEWFGGEKICNDPTGFDRAQFHAEFNRQIASFFKAHLVSSDIKL